MKALLVGRTEGGVLQNMFDFGEFFITWEIGVGAGL
jgi:hypothetical protein